jgi:site-specific recombinase XerD
MAKNVISEAISCIKGFDVVYQNFIQKLTIGGKTQRTIEVYGRNAAQIALYFNKNPLLLNEKNLSDYLFHLKTTRTGDTAFKHAIYSLRSLFENSGKKSLKTKLPSIAQKEKLPLVLSLQECKNLITTPLKLRDRFLFAFMYSSGLRINEVSRLKICDIDTDRMQIRVVQSKGNKDRYVPLSKYIADTLAKYLKMYNPREFLFNSCNGKQFSVQGIRRVFRESKKAAGILKNATSHTLRHSYATHLLENGVDLITIKNVLGHKDIRTTMIYLHVAQPEKTAFKNPLDVLFNKL